MPDSVPDVFQLVTVRCQEAVALDLGCFYEMRDGKKMLIDGLQFSHGRGGDRHHATRQGYRKLSQKHELNWQKHFHCDDEDVSHHLPYEVQK